MTAAGNVPPRFVAIDSNWPGMTYEADDLPQLFQPGAPCMHGSHRARILCPPRWFTGGHALIRYDASLIAKAGAARWVPYLDLSLPQAPASEATP